MKDKAQKFYEKKNLIEEESSKEKFAYYLSLISLIFIIIHPLISFSLALLSFLLAIVNYFYYKKSKVSRRTIFVSALSMFISIIIIVVFLYFLASSTIFESMVDVSVSKQ